MLSVPQRHRIFLAVKPIDFRKGIDGIALLCKNQFSQDPMSGHYFVFHNKRKTDLKILYYDVQGFCLYQKRLSSGKFAHWPKNNSPLLSLSAEQLQLLVQNEDPAKIAFKKPWKTGNES